MLFERSPSTGALIKLQLDSHPECALFAVSFEPRPKAAADSPPHCVAVRYLQPTTPLTEYRGAMDTVLRVPLEMDVSALQRVEVDLHGSPATKAYLVGGTAKAWFSACFGRDVELIYLGDGHRDVLGQSLLPRSYEVETKSGQGWLGWASSRLDISSPSASESARPTIAFSDVAPLLIVSEASVRDVSTRLPEGTEMDVRKFRPNIVVDAEGEDPFAEDFWGELAINDTTKLILTGNCGRCVSLNVDYKTGKMAQGEMGSVLKKLMKDRRVDKGTKWVPIFGRYAFVKEADGGKEVEIKVGDGVQVTRRLEERTTWDWDIKPSKAMPVEAAA
jgi:uncharacterized protein YcbX